MTRRELQALVGFEIGPKMQMIADADGTLYGRCEDGSWELYDDEPTVDESHEAER